MGTKLKKRKPFTFKFDELDAWYRKDEECDVQTLCGRLEDKRDELREAQAEIRILKNLLRDALRESW